MHVNVVVLSFYEMYLDKHFKILDTKDKFNEDYELHNWLKKLEEDAEIVGIFSILLN